MSGTRLVNLERLVGALEAERIDAIVATAPENVTYASGYWAMSQWIRRGPQTYVVILREAPEDATIVAATSLVDLLADQDVWVRNIRRFGYFQIDRSNGPFGPTDLRQSALLDLPDEGNAIDALVNTLTAAGVANGRIAIDEVGLVPGGWEQLAGKLPRATLTKGAHLFRRVRAVKTPEEIARLRYAARATESAIEAALAIARPGVTEREMARAFHAREVAQDCQPVLGCIGFGARSAMPNVQPGDTPLAPGQIIRFDAGGRYRHYRADIARIAVLGEADQKTRSYNRALQRGVRAALEMIKPGVKAADVFARAVDTVRREGIPHYSRSHVGHGIGLDGYDAPDLTPNSKDVIEEGMVMCVETPYYEIGWGGLQVEDTVVVRSHGVENFMTTDGNLTVVPSKTGP